MALQHFFVRGEYLGNSERDWYYVHEKYCPPWGAAFFCPVCSELWATCPVEGRNSTVFTRLCDKHPAGTGCSTPGSLSLGWDKSFDAALPTAVLRRELILEFQLAEKEGKL